jgi:hypothetical protein
LASNLVPDASRGLTPVSTTPTAARGEEASELREELRRLIIEELNTIIRG